MSLIRDFVLFSILSYSWMLVPPRNVHLSFNKRISIAAPLSSSEISIGGRESYSKGRSKSTESHNCCYDIQTSFKIHKKTFRHLWRYNVEPVLKSAAIFFKFGRGSWANIFLGGLLGKLPWFSLNSFSQVHVSREALKAVMAFSRR